MEKKKFGFLAVYFTALTTVLGAILFLRFGFAVGTVGLMGAVLLIFMGHLVTIPTALAISELATNKRVEGGGEYFIISRSFGLNIGGTLGIALYLSQTISVAFYIIAFGEAFEFFFNFMISRYDLALPRQIVTIPAMLILTAIVVTRGTGSGLKTLYITTLMLLFTIFMFFIGDPLVPGPKINLAENMGFKNMNQLFLVFSIIFPAFTGMTAGVGLSGDLKNPGKLIPRGTIAATLTGFIVYIFIAWKMAASAPNSTLLESQLVMGDIAVYGWLIVPVGLAASCFSSAISSVLVAPRTLQALAVDRSLPSPKLNQWASRMRADNEPVNSSVLTCLVAFVFVALGNVNIVAQIITMFFLVTYGSLCLISFLHHFGSSPSYRPSFKSVWYISLLGFVASIWVMFQISVLYAFLAILAVAGLYFYMNYYHSHRKGLTSLFSNAIFQINRSLQLYLQHRRNQRISPEWRPSIICISSSTFQRDEAYRLLNWISYKYGFATYLHRIDGYYSKSTSHQAEIELARILGNTEKDNHVFIDTIISPSNTSAIAQAIQIPGIAGMENNMVLFEYERGDTEELKTIIDNFRLVNSGKFDVLILSSSKRPQVLKNGIHVWIDNFYNNNSNLMILLSFIISDHPDWRKYTNNIQIFSVAYNMGSETAEMHVSELLETGRLPITSKNIEVLYMDEKRSMKSIVQEYSMDAALTIIGYSEEKLKLKEAQLFEGYDTMGDILFVHASVPKDFE